MSEFVLQNKKYNGFIIFCLIKIQFIFRRYIYLSTNGGGCLNCKTVAFQIQKFKQTHKSIKKEEKEKSQNILQDQGDIEISHDDFENKKCQKKDQKMSKHSITKIVQGNFIIYEKQRFPDVFKSFYFRKFFLNKKKTTPQCNYQNLLIKHFDFLSTKLKDVNFKQLSQKIIFNLCNYGSFYDGQFQNQYIFQDNSMIHHKQFIKILADIDENEIMDEEQNFVDTDSTVFSNCYIEMIEVFQKIKQSFINLKQELQSVGKFKQLILEILIKQTLVKEKISTLLEMISSSKLKDGEIKKDKKKNIVRIATEILFLKFIRNEFLRYKERVINSSTLCRLKTLNNLQTLCQILAEKSGICMLSGQKAYDQLQDLPIQWESVDKWGIYQKLNELNFKKVIHDENAIQVLIEMLLFISYTLDCGFAIKLNTIFFFLHEDRIKIKITKKFRITKSIDNLRQDFPELSEKLEEFQRQAKSNINNNPTKLTMQNFQSLYSIKNMTKRRKRHFFKIQKNIKFIISVIQLFNKAFQSQNFELVDYDKLQISQLERLSGKKVQVNQATNEDIQKSKLAMIQEILKNRIKDLIFKCINMLSKTNIGQFQVYLKHFRKRDIGIDRLSAAFQSKKTDKIGNLQSIANSLIGFDEMKSGIFGVESCSQDKLILKIITKRIFPKYATVLSQFNPQGAQQFLIKQFVPSKVGDATHNDVSIAFRQFIDILDKQFRNLSMRNIKSPLFLPRHLIIINQTRSINRVMPLLNVLNSFFDYYQLNQFNRPSFMEQLHINNYIDQLGLNKYQQNSLILTILLLSIIREESQLRFLQKILTFFQLRKFNQPKIKNIAKQMYGYLYGNQIAHTNSYFASLSTAQIVPIMKSQVLARLGRVPNQMEMNNFFDISNYLYNNQAQQAFSNRKPRFIRTLFGSSEGGFNYDIRIFKLTKKKTVFKNKYYIYNQSLEYCLIHDDQKRALINKCLFELNYVNMRYLNNQFITGKQFKSINPIIRCQSYYQGTNFQYDNYIVVTQQPDYENSSSQNLYEDNYSYENSIKKISAYFHRLLPNQKLTFIRYLFQIVKQANSKQLLLININPLTIKLVYNHQLKMMIPVYDGLELCRLYTENQKLINYRLYKNFFTIIQQDLYSKRYVQNEFSFCSYPPLLWEFKDIRTNQKILDIDSRYDIGDIGYFLCSILFCSDDYQIKEQLAYSTQKMPSQSRYQSLKPTLFSHFYKKQKSSEQIHSGLYQTEYLQKITSICDKIIKQFLNTDSEMCKFLKGIIQPTIQKRFDLSNIENSLYSAYQDWKT